jgi:hypothetical protein
VKKILIALWLFTSYNALIAQQIPKSIIQQFEQIQSQPKNILIQNRIPIHTQGGHIQGIQILEYHDNRYYFLSGSTDKYSYYSIARIDEKKQFITHKMILEKPFKHAGGFQIYDNLMAVGIEDNDEKKRSKVFVYKMENPEAPPEKPLAIIERFGTAKRGTAGCVAISELNDKVIIIVGDWDTKNLDFYVINKELLGVDPSALILEYSWKSSEIEKSAWIDNEWLSYQNINLIKDRSDALWLAGMATNSKGENIIDLYKVSHQAFKSFSIQKEYRRNFGANPKGSFRWGAGIFHDHDRIQILVTPENIQDQTTIQIYE